MGKNKGKKNKNKKGNNGKGSCNMNKNGQITNKKPKEKVEEEKELVIDIHLEKHNGSTKNSNFDQNFKYETRKFIDSVKRPEENKKRIIKENSKVEEEKVINKSESKEEKDDKALVNKKESQEKIRNKANPSIQRERSNNIENNECSIIDKRTNYRISGLQNIGNTCYMNSILQCIMASPGLAEFFFDDEYKKELSSEFINVKNIASNFATLLKNRNNSRVHREDLETIKKDICEYNDQFLGRNQQDASELLSALIEGLSTVLKSCDTTQNDKSDFSEIDILSEANDSFDKSGDRNKINDLFKGQTITTIICNSCYEITRVYEEFIAHTVEIPESSNGRYSSTDLSSCFAKTMEYSYFDKSNSFYCRKCNKVASINKAIKINRLPKLLIIVIKRFKTEGKYAEKDCTNIELPYEDFDLYPFLHDECLILNPCTKYHLYGVSLHSGGIGGGHYVANVKNISGDGKWYNCDDSYTGVIEEPQHSGSSPYVLFYYRDDLVD